VWKSHRNLVKNKMNVRNREATQPILFLQLIQILFASLFTAEQEAVRAPKAAGAAAAQSPEPEPVARLTKPQHTAAAAAGRTAGSTDGRHYNQGQG